jgi:hypothetical protein
MTERDPRSEFEEQGIPDLQDVGPDAGGFSAEESAVRVEDEG